MALDKLWPCFQTDPPADVKSKYLASQLVKVTGPQAGLYANSYFARGITNQLPKQSYLPRVIVKIIAEYGTTSRYDALLMMIETFGGLLIETVNYRDCRGVYGTWTKIELFRDDHGLKIGIRHNSRPFEMYSIERLLIFIDSGYGLDFEPSENRLMINIRDTLDSRIRRTLAKLNTF